MSNADNMWQWRAIDCEGCVLLCESYLFLAIVSTTVDIWAVIKIFDWSAYKHFSSLRWKKLQTSNSQTVSQLCSDWLTAASICGLPPGFTEAEIKIDVVRGWAGWIRSFKLLKCICMCNTCGAWLNSVYVRTNTHMCLDLCHTCWCSSRRCLKRCITTWSLGMFVKWTCRLR